LTRPKKSSATILLIIGAKWGNLVAMSKRLKASGWKFEGHGKRVKDFQRACILPSVKPRHIPVVGDI